MSSHGVSLVPFKRFLWIVAGLDQGSVLRFDDHAVGLENSPLILAREIHGQAFIPCLSGQYHILEEVSLSLDVPDCTRDRCRNLDGFHLLPTIQTAVRDES
jgi:hypothetical protein